MNWTKFADIAKLIVPIVIGIVKPQLAPLATTIADGIGAAEQIPGASGADKLAHVQQIASDTATTINQVSGKTVVDTSTLSDSVTEAVDTAVDVVNLLHNKVTPTQAK